MNIDASIIIVNWNTCKITCDCLRSVYEQTRDVSFEVIVVDNASSDDSVAVIQKEFPQVIIIKNSENKGFAVANNQGMAIAKGKYILLLNSDTIVLDHAIEKAIAFAEQHPEAGVVGCRLLNHDKSLQPSCFMYPSLLNMLIGALYLNKLFSQSKFFGRERMTYWGHDSLHEVETVMGAFMLAKLEAIDQVGLMDESFFMYAEEADWCYRFKKKGWKILFNPDSEIIHLGGASSKQVRPEMMAQLRASILLFMKEHRSGLSYRIACFLVSFFYLVRVPFWVLRAFVSEKARRSHFNTARIYGTLGFKALFGWRVLCSRK